MWCRPLGVQCLGFSEETLKSRHMDTYGRSFFGFNLFIICENETRFKYLLHISALPWPVDSLRLFLEGQDFIGFPQSTPAVFLAANQAHPLRKRLSFREHLGSMGNACREW